MVVNGGYRGCRAILKNLDANNFCVTIVIDSVKIIYNFLIEELSINLYFIW